MINTKFKVLGVASAYNNSLSLEADISITTMSPVWKNYFRLLNLKILFTAVNFQKQGSILQLQEKIVIFEFMIKVQKF